MSVSAAGFSPGMRAGQRPTGGWLRAYFWSDSRRRVQTVLGLIWLLDGGLQFQSFMYSRGFLQLLAGGAHGQPEWLASSVNWAVRIANGDLAVWNTLFALTQLALGLGLLYRRTVKPTLAASFAWAVVVWWVGEAFGMLFMNMANPLTGAPGAVAIYVIIGLIAWPNNRPGGLLGARNTRVTWAVLWGLMGGLWLLAANSSPDATSSLLDTAPSGMGWLTSVQHSFATAAAGHGLIIAVVLAFGSWTIAIAVAGGWHVRPVLAVAIALNVLYWVLGQGFGGIFAGGATDPNAGPLFVLLAYAIWPLTTPATGLVSDPASTAPPADVGTLGGAQAPAV